MKSRWFLRLERDVKKINPRIRTKRIRNGFYRFFYDTGYLGEVYENLNEMGHHLYDTDAFAEDRKYLEEKLEDGEIQRKIKNFEEGYWEALDKIRTRYFMSRSNPEAHRLIMQGYRQLRVR